MRATRYAPPQGRPAHALLLVRAMDPTGFAEITGLIDQTRRDSLRLLLTDIALVLELLKRATLAADNVEARRDYRQALRAYQTVVHLTERLKLRPGQRVALDEQLSSLRDGLLAALPRRVESLH